jgi:DNA polymerase-3 subunit delta
VIHLLYGPDEYRVHDALQRIRRSLADADQLLESNTTVLDGAKITPAELMAQVTAVPFLAEHRLVIVEGLLAAIGAGRGGRRQKPAPNDAMEAWRGVAEQIEAGAVPDSTTLVFVEADLKSTNSAFQLFSPIAKTAHFGPLDKGEVPQWIKDRAEDQGMNIDGRAIASLAQTIGPDLWALDRELAKLAVYADGELVDAAMVADVVSAVREAKIWELGDAVVAGNEKKALEVMQRLLESDEAAPLLAFMIARSYRQLIIVKDMQERRERQDDVAKAAGIPNFKLKSLGPLASRYSWATLRAAYAKLVDGDLSVKRGLRDDETSLHVLVHELCAMAPAATGGYASPSAARRR